MSRINKSPKHGTTHDTPQSESQPDGTGADAPRGETQAHPGPGINPLTQTKGTGRVENAGPHPSAKGSALSDTFGEAGDPYGRGNLEIPDKTISQHKRKRDEDAA
jgi:hypothetical protein